MSTYPAHLAAARARDALDRCRLEEFEAGSKAARDVAAGRSPSCDTPTADRAAREVTRAIAELVKLATGVASQPSTHWPEERGA